MFLPGVASDIANGHLECLSGGTDDNVAESSDEEVAVYDSQVAGMQTWKRASSSSPVYIGIPVDDATDGDEHGRGTSQTNGLLRHKSDRCAFCVALRELLCIYYKQLLIVGVFGITGLIFLYFSRQYIQHAIHVLETVNLGLQCLLFLVFFVICSFPLMWGYIVLVVSAGFLHGALLGSLVVMASAGAGVTISHLVLSSFLREVVKRKILPSRSSLQALISAVDGTNGMRVVALARLTPIPFGIQNAIFSVSVLPRWKYVVASMVGLLPGQVIEAYIGSSLKSLGDLYTRSHASPMNVTIVAVQIGITLCLFYYLFYLAKKELNKITRERDGFHEEAVTLIPDESRQASEASDARFGMESNSQTGIDFV